MKLEAIKVETVQYKYTLNGRIVELDAKYSKVSIYRDVDYTYYIICNNTFEVLLMYAYCENEIEFLDYIKED